MELGDLGEFGLIERFRTLLGEPAEGEVWIGDDAAVLRAPGGTILFTTDLLVAGVHFDLAWTGPEDLGYKAIAVNCSDIAAMGGTPRRAVVGLVVPADSPANRVEFLESIYRGMRECCDRYGLAVVGGDVSRGGQLVISVAMIGNPAGRRVIGRGGAEPGDAVCVTGTLGAAAAGLSLLQAGLDTRPDLRAAQLRPEPRVREAEILRRYLPSAMVDVSDGFAADLGHLCRSSGVEAWVEPARLPVVDLRSRAAGPGIAGPGIAGPGADELGIAGLDATGLALTGGEDYELCFTIAAARAATAAADVAAQTGTPVAIVGEVREGFRGLVLVDGGVAHPYVGGGWDHFRS